MKLKVVVCCRVYLFAEGISRLLQDDENLKTIGIACTDDEIVNLMQYIPDVVIADLASSTHVLNLLLNSQTQKVLLVNDAADLSKEQLLAMLGSGIGGILPREATGRVLSKAARKLHAGELWVNRQTMSEALRRQTSQNPPINLTSKEAEVLNCLRAGMTNKEIARRLYISEQTVKSHCSHLFKKFKVNNRLKLVLETAQRYPGNIHIDSDRRQ